MKWNKLMFAKTWNNDCKEGDFTGSYISEDSLLTIEPLHKKGDSGKELYRMRMLQTPSSTIQSLLDDLLEMKDSDIHSMLGITEDEILKIIKEQNK